MMEWGVHPMSSHWSPKLNFGLSDEGFIGRQKEGVTSVRRPESSGQTGLRGI